MICDHLEGWDREGGRENKIFSSLFFEGGGWWLLIVLIGPGCRRCESGLCLQVCHHLSKMAWMVTFQVTCPFGGKAF